MTVRLAFRREGHAVPFRRHGDGRRIDGGDHRILQPVEVGRLEVDQGGEGLVGLRRQTDHAGGGHPRGSRFVRDFQNQRLGILAGKVEMEFPVVVACGQVAGRRELDRERLVYFVGGQGGDKVGALADHRDAGDCECFGGWPEFVLRRHALAAQIDAAAGFDAPHGHDFAAHGHHHRRLIGAVRPRVKGLVEGPVDQVVGVQPEGDFCRLAGLDFLLVDFGIGTNAGAHELGDGDGRLSGIRQRGGSYGTLMLLHNTELKDIGRDGDLRDGDLTEGEKEDGAGGFHVNMLVAVKFVEVSHESPRRAVVFPGLRPSFITEKRHPRRVVKDICVEEYNFCSRMNFQR